MKRVLALALALGGSLGTREARGEQSVWGRARDPVSAVQDDAARTWERELLADRRLRRLPSDLGEPFSTADLHRLRARDALDAAGAATSRDPLVRTRLAQVLQALRRYADAAQHYEAALRDPRLPAPVRVDALADLAIAYARLDREEEEIDAYEGALALEPHGSSRATMLANQAEAFMVRGQISRAIAGYRASLASLGPMEAPFLAPTTLWSLGVALDRSGDLDGGLAEIARARTYDPVDARLSGPSWFFVPAYDEHWYQALGHWLVARGASDDPALRLAAYERAGTAWERYLDAAPAEDGYRAIARARLESLRREHAEAKRRAPPSSAKAPRSKAP